MSLKPLQAHSPLGQFDALDSITTTLKGGEVVFFGSVANTATTDKAAADAFDGYANPNLRAVVKLAVAGSAAERPLMLADDGIAGYGTLFGVVVGGTVGQTSYGPNSTIPASAQLGPHTALGSGKLTCWSNPGLYAVSLDAVDNTAPSSGLLPTNSSATPGVPVTYTSTGLLTPTTGGNRVGSAVNVGTFVEFQTGGSLVTTPNNLVGTLSTPDGYLTSSSRVYTYAVIWFNPATT